MFSITIDGEAALLRTVNLITERWREAARAGKPLVVTVEGSQQKHSIRQRRRYQKLLSVIADIAWHEGKQRDADWWRDHMVGRFLGEDESTANLSVGEMNDLMRQIEAYATNELNLELHHYVR